MKTLNDFMVFSERTMTKKEKSKEDRLKDKYDDSDMKNNMKDQYGEEEGEKVYYATIRKQAMKKEEVVNEIAPALAVAGGIVGGALAGAGKVVGGAISGAGSIAKGSIKAVKKVKKGIEEPVEEGVIDAVKKGAKRHAKAVQAKKIKDRKAVPYQALAAEHEPEGEILDERDARKMNVRTKGTIKKQIAKDAAAEAKRKEKKTGEYAEKPKRKVRLKKPSQLTKVTGGSKPEPKKEAPKAKPVAKKAAPKPKAKPVAAVKKVTPKAAPKKSAPKPKAKAAPKKAAPKPVAKKAAPKKEAPKKEAPKSKSVGDRVRDVIKKGVKRHKKAVQPARVFAKGFKKGVKDTAKFASKAKKAVVGEGVISFHQFSEATRLKKEKGYVKGGTKKPSGKPTAMSVVLDKIRKEHGKGAVLGQGGSRQDKKVKGAKSSSGGGKYLKRAQDKKAYAAKAKKAGFKSTQSYTDTMARYGGESNYKKGKGLGT